MIVPVESARKLVKATKPQEEESALLEAQAFVNGDPVQLLVGENNEFVVVNRDPERAPTPAEAAGTRTATISGPVAAALSQMRLERASTGLASDARPTAAVDLTPVRDTSTASLKQLQSENQDKIYRLVKDLDSQAHFVSYAPPSFVAFHDHIYLQLSTTTNLPASSAGSRYKMAALAFDDHIAHLIRPVAVYFQGQSDFDGVVFSTSTHVAGTATPEAVEFFLPFSAIHCYEQYDCTGQQVVTSSYVFINGERASLDLQIAESVSH
jgi:hypothetical protein